MTKNHPKSLQEMAVESFQGSLQESLSFAGIIERIAETYVGSAAEEKIRNTIKLLENIEKKYQDNRAFIPSAVIDLLKPIFDEESIYQKLSKGDGNRNIFD